MSRRPVWRPWRAQPRMPPRCSASSPSVTTGQYRLYLHITSAYFRSHVCNHAVIWRRRYQLQAPWHVYVTCDTCCTQAVFLCIPPVSSFNLHANSWALIQYLRCFQALHGSDEQCVNNIKVSCKLLTYMSCVADLASLPSLQSLSRLSLVLLLWRVD